MGSGCCCRCCKRRQKNRVSPHGLPYKDFPHFVNRDGNYLFCRYWEPATEPRAMLMIVHGAGEHSGYYCDFTSIFTDLSLFVFAHDHFGHGQSEGKRLTVPDFSIYVRDCQQHIDMMRDRYPTLPLFLLSQSLGATITLNVVTKRRDITGLIFLAPLVQVNAESVSASRMCCTSILYYLTPNLTMGNVNPRWLSSSAEEVQKIVDDPLSTLGPYSMRYTIQVLNAVAKLKEIIPTITVPMLIAHGELDKMCEIQGSFLLYKNVASQDKTLKIFKNALHHIHKETPSIVAELKVLIRKWLRDHLD
ncbi:monoglyceride lipase-like [Mobula hypostoma]|uniref:monoglyceride lipase-like n=1 Tax=Mobula hypostoma TaxID=723540 RepID=UPI002FC2BCEC